jgi:hypothetical protein
VSEYQYNEFQAIDRPPTREEMAALRTLTTRATITPTRLQDVYHYGDFKGDPQALMERYFDAFVYVANWGMRRFMLRLPRAVLDPATVEPYCNTDGAGMLVKEDFVLLEFVSEDDDGWDWEESGEEWMPSLLPLRADLANGDLRSLYLGWLSCAWIGMFDDEEVEPPVPPGLGTLTASLSAFAEFLRIDKDLLKVAARRSRPLTDVPPSSTELAAWIRGMPESEKDALLLRLVAGDVPLQRAELLRRYRQTTAAPTPPPEPDGRTVGELIAAAAERTERRRREETERRRREETEREAREQARREAEAAAARATYLDSLVGREEELWRRIDALVETKRPTDYDQAVRLLVDLRDLAMRRGPPDVLAAPLADLRARNAKKSSFLSRLNDANL